MARAHSLLVALTFVTAAAGSAHAQTARDCRRYEGSVGTSSELARWSRKLSLAGCLRSAPAVTAVSDAEQLRVTIAGLRLAAERSIGLYRDALHHAPWELRLLAAFSLGETYSEIAVRARMTIAGQPAPVREELEKRLLPYKLAAIDAYAQAETLASEIPPGTPADELVRNIVAATDAALQAIGAD